MLGIQGLIIPGRLLNPWRGGRVAGFWAEEPRGKSIILNDDADLDLADRPA